MNLTWQIRRAIPEDAKGLKRSMESAYAPYQKRLGGLRLPPMDVDYLSEIENYPTWVVESEGKILGGLVMIFDNDKASIANIAIDPRFQGQGIGGGLMRYAESRAKENNFSELYLTTHVLLEENLSFYRNLGWVETGRDGSKVSMKKKI